MTVERYRMNTPNVIAETLDGEALIINLHTGFYYSIDSTGAAIWALFCDGWAATEVAGDLAALFPEDHVADEVESLLAELLAEELLRPDPAAARGESVAASTHSFHPPRLKKYTDMQGLLEADPIHEVEEAGWPHVVAGERGTSR